MLQSSSAASILRLAGPLSREIVKYFWSPATAHIYIPDELLAEPPKPMWLVPDLILADTMIVLAGDPGVGKSVLSYGLGMSLALSADFLGRPVACGRTLYFDEENSAQDRRGYLDTLWRGFGCPPPALIQEAFRLEHFTLAASHDDPYERMAALAVEHRPALIVLDTATPICRIKDENDNAEASRVIRRLRAVRSSAPPGCTMLILKHARVEREKGHGKVIRRDIRGAKAWRGECDGLIFHVAKEGRPPKSGWRDTFIEPGKTRAHGLRDHLRVIPEPVNGGHHLRAIILED